MVESYFKYRHVIERLRVGEAGAFVDGFASALDGEGYAFLVARRYIRAAAHFGSWAERQGVPLVAWNEATVERFRRHLRSCHCLRRTPNPGNRVQIVEGVQRFVAHLRQGGLVAALPVDRGGMKELDAFRQWMTCQRGVTAVTLDNYERPLRVFLGAVGRDPARYRPAALRSFVFEYAREASDAKTKIAINALRMFLRYLATTEQCTPDLDAAIPTIACWRLAALPRHLPAADVERLIDSCDPTSLIGCRDRAILLLLARLGLRVGDIVRLRFDDIDWRGARLRVAGKGRREASLPLPQEVGDALLDYVGRARPRVALEAIFLTCHAPLHSFTNSAVSAIVRNAFERAGIDAPSRGGHVLRHSMATAMLREGMPLEAIGSVLRHRSLVSTSLYAKVDVTLLRQLAQPWPEVLPC